LKSAAGAIQEGAERSGRCAARRSGRGLCEPGLGSAEATEQRAWPAAYGHWEGPQPTEDCFKWYTPNYRALQIHARDPVGVAVSALSLGLGRGLWIHHAHLNGNEAFSPPRARGGGTLWHRC